MKKENKSSETRPSNEENDKTAGQFELDVYLRNLKKPHLGLMSIIK